MDAKRNMSYEEYAVELANAYPDLDLQNLSVDDIKTMMGHGLTFGQNKYGLTPLSEYVPSRRSRRPSRQKSQGFNQKESVEYSDGHVHGESESGEFIQEGVDTTMEIDAAHSSDTDHPGSISHSQAVEHFGQLSQFGDLSKFPLATQQALVASAALLSFSRGQSAIPNLAPADIAQSLAQVESGDDRNPSSHGYDMNMAEPAVDKHAMIDTGNQPRGTRSKRSQRQKRSKSATTARDDTPSLSATLRTSVTIAESGSLPTSVTLSRPESSSLMHGEKFSERTKKQESFRQQKSEPAPTRYSAGTFSDNSGYPTHNKLRQLLEVGCKELMGKWAAEENIVAEKVPANYQRSRVEERGEDAEAAETLLATQAIATGHSDEQSQEAPSGEIQATYQLPPGEIQAANQMTPGEIQAANQMTPGEIQAANQLRAVAMMEANMRDTARRTLSEQLKAMTSTEGLFKVPDDKKLPPPPPGSRGIELDTPPPGQTSLPVNYAYAPNVTIRTDNASLPLTPPQASPPEINMADLTSSEMTSSSLSNLMSKHLLSTTQGLKSPTSVMTSLATTVLDANNPVGLTIPLVPGSIPMTIPANFSAAIVSKPTTQISYLPLSNAAGLNVVFSQQGTKVMDMSNGTVAGSPSSSGIPGTTTTIVSNASQQVGQVNGIFPNTSQAGIAGPPPVKTPSKKSKKRRRKSDSSDGLSSSFGALDGSPRLIKKIGRVIQTVESEQDLNNKVDAMLKNIMGKFQQRQTELSTPNLDPHHQGHESLGQGQMRVNVQPTSSTMPPPTVEPVTEESIQKVAKVIGAMATPPDPPPAPPGMGIKPPSKKKSKPKKKPTSSQESPRHQGSSQPSPLGGTTVPLTVQLPDPNLGLAAGNVGVQQTKTNLDQFIQFPFTSLSSGNLVATQTVSALNQPLLQSPNIGLQPPVTASKAPTTGSIGYNVATQPAVTIAANQLMPTSEALAAAKKMLLDAGITLPESVVKATTLDGITYNTATQSAAPMLSSATPQQLSSATVPILAAGMQLPTQPLQLSDFSTTAESSKQTFDSQTSQNLQFLTSPHGVEIMTSHDALKPEISAAQLDIQNSKAKKRKKKTVEKLSETDIANIAQLLKMANSQYFAEFFNQLQAFAFGKNPDWMKQYPNIASYMGLKSDSTEKAKQILEYMRQQTGILEGEKMTALTKMNYDNAMSAAKQAESTSPPNAPVIPVNKSNPALAGASLPAAHQAGGEALKYSHMNGNDTGTVNQEASFIDSFQHFLHSKVPGLHSTQAPSSSRSKKGSRSAKSPSSSSNKSSSSLAADLAGISPFLSSKDPSGIGKNVSSLDTTLKALFGSAGLDTKGSFNVDSVDMKSLGDHQSQFSLDSSGSQMDLLQGTSLVEKLRRNYSDPIEDVPKCDCLKGAACHDEGKEGPFYTHLGAAPDISSIRQLIQNRLKVYGPALRIERVLHTSKVGKTSHGAPIPRWILRRSGPEEKVLCIVRPREGHHCRTAVLVIAMVMWDALPSNQADALYGYLSNVLPKSGNGAKRHKRGTGDNNELSGVAHHLGCSYSTHARTCRHAKNSGTPRKFKLDNQAEEAILEEKLEGLATELAPLCKTAAPDAYKHMVSCEEEGADCRLGSGRGRPFSGVTALIDSSSHCQKLRSHCNNGCSLIVTLKGQQQGQENGSEDNGEALHVFPMCILDTVDESGSTNGQFDKLRTGAIEYLTKTPQKVGLKPQHNSRSAKLQKLKNERTVSLRKSKRHRLVPQEIISRLNLKSVTHCVPRKKVRQRHGVNRLLTNSSRLLSRNISPLPFGKNIRNKNQRRKVFSNKTQDSTKRVTRSSRKNIGKTTSPRKSCARSRKGAKTKRWQEMMSDPAFVNNLMTVGQQMYGSEAENMVGRLKTVAEQDNRINNQQDSVTATTSQQNRAIKNPKLSPKSTSGVVDAYSNNNKSPKLCSQTFLNISATWENWYSDNWLENGSCTPPGVEIRRSSKRLKRPLSAPMDSQSLQASQSKRPRSCTPTGCGPQSGNSIPEDSGSKPEEVAGWGMYSMPPNRSVFDIDSPRKSISVELLRSVNRLGSQTSVQALLSPTAGSSTQSEAKEINGPKSGQVLTNGPTALSQSPMEINHYDVTEPISLKDRSESVKTMPEKDEINSHLHRNNLTVSKSKLKAESSHNQSLNKTNKTKVKGSKVRRKVVASGAIPDADMGGVAIALEHGSILLEVSKREMHASAIRNKKSQNDTGCISLLFHQQKGLNLPKHGREEHLQFEEMRRSKGGEIKMADIEGEAPESEVKVKDESEVMAAPVYKYMWDTSVVSADTSTVNSHSYSWLKPQTAVSGPYQRWL